MHDQIAWQDYDALDGFGGGGLQTQEAVNDLNKALYAGSAINNPGASPGEGFPLRVESLERTLKNTTYRMEHLRLFKAMPKMGASNTVEEHNELSSYGIGEEGFVAEGQLPEEEDSTYERKYATIKFLGTTRRVSHVATLVKPAHGNLIANETVSGTMWLLRVLERALFFANSELSSLQFDGFEKMILDKAPAANIIDMRGQPLDEDTLIDASLTIGDAPNYGIPTHIHMNPKVKADLVKSFFPKGKYDLGQGAKGDMVGLDLKGFTSPVGDVMYESNTFITDGGGPAAAGGDPAKRPAVPTITTAATTPVDAASLFAADDAGSYIYKITAHTDFGRSAAVAVDAGAIAIAAGDKMTFGVTAAGGPATKWYQLYRTKKGGAAGTERLIARIPNTAGVGELTVNDYNTVLPGTTSAFMWQQNQEAMTWKQLAPLLKIALATTGPEIKWMQLLYGVPVLYMPGRSVLLRNVGRAVGSKGA